MSNWLNGSEFVREACNMRFDWVEEFYKDWKVVPEPLKEWFLDSIEANGVDGDNTPGYYVDNFIINGEWGPASNWNYKKEELQQKLDDGEISFICENPDDPEDPIIAL